MAASKAGKQPIKKKMLTSKQEMFCLEYIKDLNATQAAIRSGYSERTASVIGNENLTKPYVQKRIAELKKERSDELKIDAAWVLKQAVEVHNRCMESAKVTDRQGNPIKDEDGNPVYTFQHQGATKSLELIGKHVDVQAFKEQLDVTGAMEITPWSEIKAGVDKKED